MRKSRWAVLLLTLILPGAMAAAARVSFTPRELFRIPFGKERERLGTRIEGGLLLIPREFTMDGAGHFYINDSNKHRIARFSDQGTYEMEFRYLPTARQLFAHADSSQNLWLLISDPAQGTYYGIYDPRGKRLKAGIFSRFNRFRLHLDDNYTLRVILSSDKDPAAWQTYVLDEKSLLMKKENIAPPPENHHQVRRGGRVYFIDQVPGGAAEDAQRVNRVTDEYRRAIADIKGTVIYVTGGGEIYTRVGKREIRVYEADGSLKGKVRLQGLSGACASIRFDPEGNLYLLDGIPDQTDEELRRRVPPVDKREDFEDLHYTSEMPGMRLIQWERR
jgi:hypothetical protein